MSLTKELLGFDLFGHSQSPRNIAYDPEYQQRELEKLSAYSRQYLETRRLLAIAQITRQPFF